MSQRRRSSLINQGVLHHTNTAEDDDVLAKMGHKSELARNFSMLSMLGMAFAILNSWTALAASLNLALPSGGPSSVLWGLITAGIFNLTLAASMAEFLSAYPTAGGQYHWVSIISWKGYSRGLSWVTGWINVSGWIALTATGGLLGSQLIMGVISLYNPAFEAQRWQQFLIYIGYTLVGFFINVYLTRILPTITTAAFWWSVTGFVVISITVLATAAPTFQPASFVYGGFLNEVAWPDGFAWLLGLLQGALALTGFDATAHMIEEIPEPQIYGPKILIYCILIGMGTGWVFLSCLMFAMTNVDDVNTDAAGPLLTVLFQATNNRAGSVCLLMFPLICLIFATIGIMSTSSRMTWAFARDRGIPFSTFFAKVHPGLDTPVRSLALTTGLVIIFGCIFLGSSSAFNAIVSASVVALGISYAMPPAINILRGRKMLPPDRSFILPEWLGWTCNIAGVLWTLLTTVLFVFPPELPVTGNNMNYCIVAFAIILVISVIQWIVDGHKNYTGPQIDVAAIREEATEGMRVDTHDSYPHELNGGEKAQLDGRSIVEADSKPVAELNGHQGVKPAGTTY